MEGVRFAALGAGIANSFGGCVSAMGALVRIGVLAGGFGSVERHPHAVDEEEDEGGARD
jgi:hypothetical protein